MGHPICWMQHVIAIRRYLSVKFSCHAAAHGLKQGRYATPLPTGYVNGRDKPGDGILRGPRFARPPQDDGAKRAQIT
jgi:hypothetical protein